MIRLFNKIDRVIDKIYTFLIKSNFKHFGNNSIISFKCRFDMPSNISIGDNVTICKNVWLNGGDKKRDDNNPTLIIGNGVHVGSNCHINAFNEVIIEDEVLFAENVYLGDTDHRNNKKDIPIIKQGNIIKNPVKVKRGSFLCKNSVISAGVEIGTFSIVGPNSFVRKVVPKNKIAIGNPARNFDLNKI